MNAEQKAKLLIDLYGGREELLNEVDGRLNEFNQKWNQDSEKIGRVLKAHLVVEHYLTHHIEATYPGIGSLDKVRLGFAQKVGLLGEKDHLGVHLAPGLKRLNKIRNRLAHNLSIELTDEDRSVFLSIGIFKAIREQSGDMFGSASDDALSVMEGFAKFAAGLFQASASPNSKLWAEVHESE